MSYPWDFETEATVRADAEEVLDYVKENKDWFLDQLGIASKKEIQQKAKELFREFYDEFDHVRRLRDSSHEYETDEMVRMYEWVQQIEKAILQQTEV